MSKLWSSMIRLIASDHPVFYADFLYDESPEPYEKLGIMTPDAPGELAECPECDDYCDIEVLHRNGQDELYCVCADHGWSLIDPLRLRRWRLHLAPVLDQFVEKMEIKGARTPIVPDMVWKLGRRNRRDFIFIKYCHEEHIKMMTAELVKHPKAVLVTITPESADRLSITLPNRKFSWIETIRYDPGESMVIDFERIEAMIGSSEANAAKAIPRRAVRMKSIELLVDVLKDHYRMSKDHYYTTGDLLPRPTQVELARQTNLQQHDVSRCLKDPDAKFLQMLWENAEDMRAILNR